MCSFDYTIRDPMGLHAGPARIMVQRLKELSAKVTVRCGDRRADGHRLFQLMGMAVKCGETITVDVEGGDETLRDELLVFFQDNY